MALPFFMLGYFIPFMEKRLTRTQTTRLYCFTLILFIGEHTIIRLLNITKLDDLASLNTFFLYPLVAFIMIWLIKTPLPKYSRVAFYSRKASLFIYCSHMLILRLLNTALQLLGLSVASYVMLLLVICIAFFVAVAIAQIDNNYLNVLIGEYKFKSDRKAND